MSEQARAPLTKFMEIMRTCPIATDGEGRQALAFVEGLVAQVLTGRMAIMPVPTAADHEALLKQARPALVPDESDKAA